MKSLFWEVIQPRNLKDTLWEKLDDTKIKINKDSLEDKFCQVKKAPPKKEEPTEAKKEKATFISSDRTRMINIVLNKIHLDSLEISDAIEQYNLEILNQDRCDLLVPIMPKDEEIKEVATFNGDVLADLATADQFVLIISGIIGYKERVKSIIFQYNYLDDYIVISKEINRFTKVFKFLKEDKNLAKLFEILLAFGNYMNGGGFKGGAYGFTITSISKFADTKSKDNKSNFIDYIVAYIYNQLKDEELLPAIIKKLKKFGKLQYQNVTESCKQLESRWKDVKDLKKVLEQNKDQLLQEDRSEEFLKGFYNDGEEKVTEIVSKVEKIETDYADVAKFLGIDPKKTDINAFITLFRKFGTDLDEANTKFVDRRERAKRSKK